MSLTEEVLEKQKATLGTDHAQVLAIMGELAEYYRSADKNDEAMRLNDQVLRLCESKSDSDCRTAVPFAIANLAMCHQDAGKRRRGFEVVSGMRAQSHETVWPRRPDNVGMRQILGQEYANQGKPQEAIAPLEETVKGMKAAYGADATQTLSAMRTLGFAYRAAGRLEEAIRLLKGTLEKQKTRLGTNHQNTAMTMAILGGTYMDAGRHDESSSIGPTGV